MSITYSTLFARLGKFVKWANKWLVYQDTLTDPSTGAYVDIQGQFAARPDLVDGLDRRITSQASQVSSWIPQDLTFFNATLADNQVYLNAPNTSPSTILPLLIADMVANSQTVIKNVVSTPTVAANGGNIGNGVLVCGIDNIAGNPDERIVNEIVSVTCNADQFGGTAAGGESFAMVGYPQLSSQTYGSQGNGQASGLRVADMSGQLLTNGSFETYALTPNMPDGWTHLFGTIGTNIKQDTSNFHTGANCLEYLGDGTTTQIDINQALTPLVNASTIYVAGIWLRKSGTVATTSNLQVAIKGTGFTTVNLYNTDPNGLTTSYVLYTAFFSVPSVIPPDLNISINWTAANNAGASAIILIDDCVVALPFSFGRVQYGLFRGSTDFIRGDSIQVATANNNAGVFQSFFGRFYGVQLPSAASSSETINDTLAT